MYPTEEQIKKHNEEAEEAWACSTALGICLGDWEYSSFLMAHKGDKEYIEKINNLIRHYLSLPQYKHLPVPEGFEM